MIDEHGPLGEIWADPDKLDQVIGKSSPLILIVLTSTGAVPLSVTRLLLLVIKFVPFRAKGALPPALLIVFLAKVPRLWMYEIVPEKSWPGQKSS